MADHGKGRWGDVLLASRGQYVPLFDFATNVLPAFLSCNVRALHQFGLQREVRIFDHISEPTGYIAILDMKKPGLIINTIRDLKKQHDVLSLEVQLSIRPRKRRKQLSH